MNEANTHAEAMGPAGETLDQAHERLGHTAPRVSQADLEANIAHEYYFTAEEGVRGSQIGATGPTPGLVAPLALLTICVLVLRNGFTVTGVSAPASPENFNAELGRKWARENAARQLWPLMGYALREKLSQMDER